MIQAIEELKEEVDIPTSIKAVGIPEDAFYKKLDEMAELAFDDQCTGTNPRYPLINELKELYIQAYDA